MANFSFKMDDFMDEVNSMDIDFECPNCEHEVSFTLSDVGSSVICPNCGLVINLESAD